MMERRLRGLRKRKKMVYRPLPGLNRRLHRLECPGAFMLASSHIHICFESEMALLMPCIVLLSIIQGTMTPEIKKGGFLFPERCERWSPVSRDR